MLGFVFKIYLSRQISTSVLGAYTVALSVSMVFVTILSSGLPLVISRNVAGNSVGGDNKKSHSYVSAGLVLTLILSLVICLVIGFGKNLFSVFFTDNSSYTILLTLIPFIVFSGIYAPFRGYLWGKERYFEVSVVEFIEQIIKIIICVILFSFSSINSILPAGLSISLACALSTFLGYIFYKKENGRFYRPQDAFVPLVKSTLPLTSVRFVGSLLTPLISIVLPLRLIAGGFSNEQALSCIGIAMGMTMPILNVPSTIVGSLSMALIPQLSMLQKYQNSSALKKQICSAILFSLIASACILPMFAGIGSPICNLLFNNAEAGRLLVKFAWIIVPTALMQISTSILNSLGKEVYTFFTYAIGGVVMIVGILVLPTLFGIDALLLSMGINAIIVSILNYIKIWKLTHISYGFIKKFISVFIISWALTYFCRFTLPLINYIFPSFISICLVCGLCLIFYFILLITFNVVTTSYFGEIKKKVFKQV